MFGSNLKNPTKQSLAFDLTKSIILGKNKPTRILVLAMSSKNSFFFSFNVEMYETHIIYLQHSDNRFHITCRNHGNKSYINYPHPPPPPIPLKQYTPLYIERYSTILSLGVHFTSTMYKAYSLFVLHRNGNDQQKCVVFIAIWETLAEGLVAISWPPFQKCPSHMWWAFRPFWELCKHTSHNALSHWFDSVEHDLVLYIYIFIFQPQFHYTSFLVVTNL